MKNAVSSVQSVTASSESAVDEVQTFPESPLAAEAVCFPPVAPCSSA